MANGTYDHHLALYHRQVIDSVLFSVLSAQTVDNSPVSSGLMVAYIR